MLNDKFTIAEEMIMVGDNHTLYTQKWGNDRAEETILFLHGGPGSGCSEKHKSLFNPQKHRVIFIDQRGCGKSTPYGSIVGNNTANLVEDISTVMSHYNIVKFAITGGSWGSCLALAYAIKYPNRVTRLVLRGIFTGRQSEIDFLNKGQFRQSYPDVWQRFVESVPAEYRNDPSEYHLARVLSGNKQTSKKSAYAFSELEGSLISLDDRQFEVNFDEFDPVPTIIECLYMANGCFMEDNYIMNNVYDLKMPVYLIQGRYDMVCPPYTAYDLHQKLTNSQLMWTVAGHSGNDRSNWDLVKTILDN